MESPCEAVGLHTEHFITEALHSNNNLLLVYLLTINLCLPKI